MDRYLEEKEHLDYTYECIDEELKFVKKEIERLRREGISLSYEDAKRGAHLNVGARLNFYGSRIATLNKIVSSPYFGRFDFKSFRDGEEKKIYIGKTSLNKERDFVITDWRAPICSLYYDSNVGYASYDSLNGKISGRMMLKRQINIVDGKLIDVIDSDLVSNDELLKPYLSVNADNKMKTIIESIQQEQNHIIRLPISNNIIVQGVAGSGKTSVALHRIAYLIYNLGDNIDSKQFLVLGPNDYFLNYISSILPELETEPVDQKTFFTLACEYLNEQLVLEDYNDAKLKKNETNLLYAMQEYKSSLRFKELLDLFLEYFLKNNVVLSGFEIDGEEIFTVDQIKERLFARSDGILDFDGVCNYFVYKYKENIDSIYESLNKKYRDVYSVLPKGDPKRKEAVDKSAALYKTIKDKGVKLLKDYFKKLKVKPLNLYKLFISSLDEVNTGLSIDEVTWLQKKTLLSLRKKQVSFEDLPALMHINYVLGKNQIKYKHIVVDEAQDYGLFHFDVLKEITPCNSTYSIYGDLAQAIYSYRSIKSWDQLNEFIFDDKFQILNLNKSYRTTIEITNNANKVLNYMDLGSANPVIRHGSEVLYSDICDDVNYKINIVKEWIKKGYKTVAIICKTEEEAKKVNLELLNYGIDNKYISSKDDKYEGGVFVLTSVSAKGLEFDAVVINDASSNVYNCDSDVDMHLLYVACTRALHEQVILYNGELTMALGDAFLQGKKLVRCKQLV